MRLSKLVEGLRVIKALREDVFERTEVFWLSADSRECRENSLFFCFKGENIDSHAYATEAVKKGAVALVVERKLSLDVPQLVVENAREAMALIAANFYGNPSENLKIIGITGTNGKTTTSYMLASIFEKAGKKTGVIGTLGIKFGSKQLSVDLTTPDPIALQKTLAEMMLCGVEYVVMEVSAHALYYKKTAGVRFCACIFTNLTQDHLDFFKTMDAYAVAKSTLFLPNVCPLAVLNGDDDRGRTIANQREAQAEKNQAVKTVFYGLHTPSDVFAVVTDETLLSTECMLNVNDRLCRVSLSLTGKHNVYNALAAAACADALGITSEEIEEGLTAIKAVKGRLEKVGETNGAQIFVDFAHTPDGLGKSLDSLRLHCKGRLLCLFGCGGNRDKTKRPLMGEIAAKKSDFTVLTSDNPRYEDPLDIITDIEGGYRRFSVKYVVVPQRQKALEYALSFLKKGDILLVAGKGGEEYQEIMGIKYPFNDQAIIEKLLEKKGNLPLS